jgi:hypothetical protein
MTWDGPDIHLRFQEFQSFTFGIAIGFDFNS